MRRLTTHLLLDCRRGVCWGERTPTGKLKKRWGAEFWAWQRPMELGDAGSQAAYLAALAAAESAQIAYGELRARAEQIAADSSLGPVIEALMCVRGCGFSTALAFAAEMARMLLYVGKAVQAAAGAEAAA